MDEIDFVALDFAHQAASAWAMADDTQNQTAAIQTRLAPIAGDRLAGVRVGATGAVTLVLETGGMDAPAREALERDIREALGEMGAAEVRVAHMAERSAEAPSRKGPRLIAVGSGKGGVGKSTLSANLAVALARKGRKVGLVDADIYGPSQPRLLAAEGLKPQAREKQLIPVQTSFGVKMLSMGQLVEAGKAIAWRGPMAAGALTQLMEADWGEIDDLVIDLPPGTGDVQLTMIQKFKPAGAVIVSTPQDLALIDATRAIAFFEKADVPVLGVVENMAGYVCPHCGEASDPFGTGGAEAEAKRLGYPFLGRIPLAIDIRTASDAGQPPAAGEGAIADAFAALADRLLEGVR